MPCEVIVPFPIALNYVVGMPLPRSCMGAEPAETCPSCDISPSAIEELRLKTGEYIAQQLASSGREASRLNLRAANSLEWEALRAVVMLYALGCSERVCEVASRLNRQVITC